MYRNLSAGMILAVVVLWGMSSWTFAAGPGMTSSPNIVFLISEDPSNYKATQTIPAFADMLRDQYGCRCTVLKREGDIKSGEFPAAQFPGLEAIKKADLVVVFFRRCALPEKQLEMIRAYLAAGKPLVGVRTANHAFVPKGKVAEGHTKWEAFCSEVLGCGVNGFGPEKQGVQVHAEAKAADHPILAGVSPTEWRGKGSLYLVKPIDKTASVLLTGSAGKKSEPVAWTRMCKKSRVFYTTLGYPDDFQLPQFTKLLVNGIFWAMDRPVPKHAPVETTKRKHTDETKEKD
jgi:type 1 glutamine amidotransferase